MGPITILVMMLAGILFAGMAIGVGKLVSTKRKSKVKGEAYECGIETEGRTWTQFNVGYYLFSLSFLIFDVEMVFLYPWAVSLKTLGPVALVEIILFMVFLLLGLLYAFKKKALKWK
ncbi:MAG: NADH-quinone oxidoreductase subunit A [Bacteroidales bacterium]